MWIVFVTWLRNAMHIIVSLELVGLLYVFGQCRPKVAVVAAADSNKDKGVGV